MGKVTDVRPVPGDIVLVRGTLPISVMATPAYTRNMVGRIGVVTRESLGIVLSVDERMWTYVLWSEPSIMGWCIDGALRRVKC